LTDDSVREASWDTEASSHLADPRMKIIEQVDTVTPIYDDNMAEVEIMEATSLPFTSIRSEMTALRLQTQGETESLLLSPVAAAVESLNKQLAKEVAQKRGSINKEQLMGIYICGNLPCNFIGDGEESLRVGCLSYHP